MDRLYAQLHLWAGTPHEWSYCDCFMVMADWVRIVSGRDPAAHLRGTYGDPDVCPVARAYRADPIPVVAHAFADLPVADAARFGDVALVQVRGNRFLCGAIKLKNRAWAMKIDNRGVAVVSRGLTPVRVWGVGYAP